MTAGVTIGADLLIKEARERARRRRITIAVLLVAAGGGGWFLHSWGAARSAAPAAGIADPCALVSTSQVASVLGLEVAWKDVPAFGGRTQSCRWTTVSISKPQYPAVRRSLLIFSWPSTLSAFEHNASPGSHAIRITNLDVPAYAFTGAASELNVWKDGAATSFIVGYSDYPLRAAEAFARVALERM
ncbi:MAG TPA: hypothetical protein VGL76_00555 [Gaiellaceae bacterium]|jgi:hypothetical protein